MFTLLDRLEVLEVLNATALIDHAVGKLKIHLQLADDGRPSVGVTVTSALVDDVGKDPWATLVDGRNVLEEAISLLLQVVFRNLDGCGSRCEGRVQRVEHSDTVVSVEWCKREFVDQDLHRVSMLLFECRK
jgi:hypothetical protein